MRDRRARTPSACCGGASGRSFRHLLLALALCVLATTGAWASAPQDAAAPPALQATARAAATPSSAPPLRIGVMTMQPGTIFFERFGHDSLIVDDRARGEPISYNFGFFNMDEPGFTGNFVRGVMMYQLVALPLRDDLRYYDEVGRGVSVQWLDLTPTQARSIADALAVNALPQNARYRYLYFTDNCATRVRDAIDRALDGGLKRQIEGRSHGNTYRSEAVRLASPAPWMWLGFDVGLGPLADTPMTLWDESYVPMRLAAALREVKGSAGRPLVASEQLLLPHRIAAEPAETERIAWPWLLTGLLAAAALWGLSRRAPRALAGVALPVWLLCSVVGGLMIFLWVGTEHRFAWGNHNLLLFNPLCLLLLPGGWRMLRGRTAGRAFDVVVAAVAGCTVIAAFVLWLPVAPQHNAPWLSLMLPVHVTLWWTLRRRTPMGLSMRATPEGVR